mmetsp:Transcript_15630/g.33848  ORF Transcript_15630/g.33848 Transcript_15630/m.33848 type:complete len:227 (-) Transcript_15630:1512-2192(-)
MLILKSRHVFFDICLFIGKDVNLIQKFDGHGINFGFIIPDGGINPLLELVSLGLCVFLVCRKQLNLIIRTAFFYPCLSKLRLKLGYFIGLGICLVLCLVHFHHEILHDVFVLFFGILSILLGLLQKRIPCLDFLLQPAYAILSRTFLRSFFFQFLLHPLIFFKNISNFLSVLLLRILQFGPHAINPPLVLFPHRLLILLDLVQHPLLVFQFLFQFLDRILRHIILI